MQSAVPTAKHAVRPVLSARPLKKQHVQQQRVRPMRARLRLVQLAPVPLQPVPLQPVPLRRVQPQPALQQPVSLLPVRRLLVRRLLVPLRPALRLLAKLQLARPLPDGRVLECGWRVVPPSSSGHTLFQVINNLGQGG